MRRSYRRSLILCVVFSALLVPSTVAPQSVGTTYPDTPAGLKSLLQELADLAASDDHAKSSSAFHGLEIPDSNAWFASLLNADSAKQVAVAYAINPAGREDDLTKLLATVKTRDRQVMVTAMVASASRPLAPVEQAFSSAMTNPQTFYSVKLVDLADNSVIPVGYFVQAASNFRFIDLATLQAVDTSKPLRIRTFHGGPELKAIHKPQAAFPEEARDQNLSGKVVLEAVVGTDGSVKEAKSLSGPTLLVQAAQDAVMRWTFEPPRHHGTPVEVITPVEMIFNLAGALPAPNSVELYRPEPGTLPPSAYPEKSSGLDKELHDVFKARKVNDKTTEETILRSLVLPDPQKWFTDNFGPDAGKLMAEQYVPVSHQLVPILKGIINHMEDMKFTTIDVRKFDHACDDQADDYVYPLLLARTGQTPLYEATFRNGNSYNKMNSFVFLDGAFRYIGRINIPDSLLFDEMRAKASDKPATTATPKALKMGGAVAAGRLVKRVSPTYPENARTSYTQGTVRLLAVIQEDGSMGELRVAKGVCTLSKAAIDAVKQWKYQPFTVNGQPIRIYTTIETSFTLNRQ